MNIFYLLVLTLVVLIAIAGVEETSKLIYYLDLQLRYLIIKIRMWFFKMKLKKQLNLPPRNWENQPKNKK
jgi:hypothetical protein